MNQACSDYRDQLNTALNSAQSDFATQGLTVTLARLDVFDLFGRITLSPAKYGFTNVTAGAATLGQYSTTVANQVSFTSSISDALTSGVGSLVDADMNVASTRLQALQTQQQLGIQALSIANQNSQLILKLFQ